MDRRRILALVVLALLAAAAGCSSQGSISMDPVDNASLAERGSQPVDVEDSRGDGTLVRETIENGSATVVENSPPTGGTLPFRYEGSFYNVSYTEAGTQPGYEGDVLIDYNATSIDGDVVDYGDLPPVDRSALELLVTEPGIPDEALEPGYDFGTRATYTEAETNSSVLAVEQEYDAVRYDGEVYPIAVEVAPETLTVYQYESTLVAENATAYAATLRENYGFELSGLSEAERGVVEGALNGTNYIEDSDNDGFDSLVDRFRTHRAVGEDEYDGQYVVRYDGQLYWAELNYGNYVDD